MDFTQLLFYFIVIIPSAIVHEVAHGLAAYLLGDDTAKQAGRLTLNPLPHIDPFGTIILPVGLLLLSGGSFIFAYAKPVPYNPFRLKSERDELKVALAGPLSNFILALFFSLLARLAFASAAFHGMALFFALIVIANIGLGIFNLLPIPPLDGSKLFYLFIPKENLAARAFLNQYGTVILLFFVIFGFRLIMPVIIWLADLLLGPATVF